MNADNLKKEIKKIKVGHVALLCAGIFLAFAIIGSILVTLGGGWLAGSWIDFRNFTPIGPGTLYEVNDREKLDLEGVERIVIATVSDDVTVLAGGEKAVAELKGQCRSVEEPVKLAASKSGGTVTIEVKYPNTVHNSTTRLTVTIPESFAGDLSVKTVSGDLVAEDLPFALGAVRLSAVSGDFRFGTRLFGELRADTTSGEVRIDGISGRVTVGTVSGDVRLDYNAAASTSVSTVSGSVRAAVPKDLAFQVDFKTTSGDFHSSHGALYVEDASRGFKGSMEGATEPLKVSTTSGDFDITEK